MSEGGEIDFSKERVGALTDGVVAIAATLLVLELKVPAEVTDLTLPALVQNLHLFVGWLISMAMIATIWYEQHFLFHRTPSWNNGLIVVTFLQLGTVSLIPFASGLVADYPESLTAAVLFASVMLTNGVLIASNGFVVGAMQERRGAAGLSDKLRLRAVIQVVCYLGITGLSIAGAAWRHPFLGVIAWSLSPFLVAVFERRRTRRSVAPDREPSVIVHQSVGEL